MAQAQKNGLAEFRLRRTKKGLRVTVKTDPMLEESFKSARYSLQRFDILKPTGELVSSVEYHAIDDRNASNLLNDDTGRLLFAKGSSEGEGIDVTLYMARSRTQLQELVDMVETFLKRWYRDRLRALDFTVSARIAAGADVETETVGV